MADDMQNKRDAEAWKDYGKSALAAALLVSAVGAAVKRRRGLNRKDKIRDVENNNTAIVVPIDKAGFMKDVPTPEIQATVSRNAAPGEMSESDVDAAKKSILRGAGRKVSAFKFASEGGRDDNPKATDRNGEPPTPTGKDDDGKPKKEDPGLPRNSLGQFVSPTDPVAVDSEKTAGDDGGWDWWGSLDKAVTDPLGTLNAMWRSARRHSLGVSGAVLGTIAITSAIGAAVNKRRAKKAKDDAESARSEYVSLLTEKNAQDAGKSDGFGEDENPFVGISAGLAVPAVLALAVSTAVTAKLMENRRREKRRADHAPSFPNEPTILYKVSEDSTIQASPESVMATILVKQAMIEYAESMVSKASKEASAMIVAPEVGLFDGGVKGLISRTFYGTNNPNKYTKEQMGDLVDTTVGRMFRPDNSDKTLELIKGVRGGTLNEKEMENSLRDIVGNDMFERNKAMYGNVAFVPTLMASENLQNNLIGRFNSNDGRYKNWGGYRDDLISESLGLDRTSLWGKFVMWLLNATGIGRKMFNSSLPGELKRMQGATNGGAGAPATSATAPATGAQTAAPPPQATSTTSQLKPQGATT